jgi:antitoxin HicB
MQEVTYKVHVEPADEGGFIAYFPDLPGCHTQGETFDEVIAMAKDALVGHLESLREHGEPVPREESQIQKVGFGFEFPLRASLIR